MSGDQKPWKKWQYSYFKAHGGNIEQWELNQVLTGSFQSLFPHWLCHTPSLCFQCIHQWVRVRFVGQNPLLNRFQICVGECTKFKENINSEVQSHQMPAVFAISEIKLVVIISFSFVKYSVDVMGSLNILIFLPLTIPKHNQLTIVPPNTQSWLHEMKPHKQYPETYQISVCQEKKDMIVNMFHFNIDMM